ncbi:hypothetical protein M7I_2143 [Glarea lozoyensis 74030]|uniref:Uncharacterized protein n=1 Tax=Glarea lozoyensis (strain ATCC 74030 / MF5533) TaxID=1104152 RepID=H0EHZ8_GLAL7|nr:hypothetical protein M7I_2143 [Glarea lozoyensis 74030]
MTRDVCQRMKLHWDVCTGPTIVNEPSDIANSPTVFVTRPTFRPASDDGSEPQRADANEMYDEIKKILDAAQNDTLNWMNWDGLETPAGLELPEAPRTKANPTGSKLHIDPTKGRKEMTPLDNNWVYEPDEGIAGTVVNNSPEKDPDLVIMHYICRIGNVEMGYYVKRLPRLQIQAYKEGMTLQLHQNLYERYSTLALSFPTDRPRAIAGLERRLMKALHSKGGYGVFQSSTRNQDFFHRGLLWQRAGKELKRLDGIEGSVPTWSWMAYEGEIRYMNVPFLDIEKNRDIGSPFEDLEEGVVHSDLVDRGPAELRARVWRVREVVKGRVIWDEGEGVQKKGKKVGGGDENQNLKNGRMWCVIVGKSVKPRDEGRIAYVIMVGPVTDLGKDNQGKGKLYQRRGVGYLNVDDLEDEDGGGQEIGSIR